MSVFGFSDDDASYLAWLAAHPDGCVINIARSFNAATARMHHAHCRTITGQLPAGRTWTGPYVKVCAERLDELERWAIEQVGERIPPCGTCRPPTAGASPGADQTIDRAAANVAPDGDLAGSQVGMEPPPDVTAKPKHRASDSNTPVPERDSSPSPPAVDRCTTLLAELMSQWTRTRAALDREQAPITDDNAFGATLGRLTVLLELAGEQIAGINELIPPLNVVEPSETQARIAATFNDYFERFDCRITPRDVVVGERRSVIDEKWGWFVRYRVDADSVGQPVLEFYAINRTANDRHARINADGSGEILDAISEVFVHDPSQPDGGASEFQHRNETIGRELRRRGLI